MKTGQLRIRCLQRISTAAGKKMMFIFFALMFKVKSHETTRLDYSNRTCHFFHSHFNFRLNQLNKDQNHQKDSNNIRHADKKLTQNEVSTANREYFWFEFCFFSGVFPGSCFFFHFESEQQRKTVQ